MREIMLNAKYRPVFKRIEYISIHMQQMQKNSAHVFFALAIVSFVLYLFLFDVFPYNPSSIAATVRNAVLAENKAETEPSEKPSIFDTCPLRHRDPWDKDTIRAIGNQDLQVCTPEEPLTSMKDGIITKNKKHKRFNDTGNCFGRCTFYNGAYKTRSGPWINIDKKEKFECDIIELKCDKKENSTTDNYNFVHTQIWEYERDRLKSFPGNGQKLTNTPKIKAENLHPDVHVVLIDSGSINTAFRELGKTVTFLEESLEAVKFEHIAKVAENSKPNAVAFFFGEIPIAVDRSAFGNPTPLFHTLSEHETCNRPLDNESFVMFEYEDAGYKTMYASDFRLLNFVYVSCAGIKSQLATHYIRPFNELIGQKHIAQEVINGEKCREAYHYLVNYQEQFINAYKDKPKFSFIWLTNPSHDYEKPLYNVDHHLLQFFAKNKEKLDNSIVIFMGDHGPRYGSATSTAEGLLDRSNPMFFMSLPKELRGSPMHETLKKNSQYLSSMHDIHATFADIIRHQPSTNFTDTSYKKINGSYGSSFLREFDSSVPRTCKHLPIPSQYCLCDYGQQRVMNDKLEETLGKQAVLDMNNFLKERNLTDLCEPVEFSSVSNVFRIKRDSKVNVYHIQYATKHGNFKTTYLEKEEGKYEMAGKMWDRLDRYGKAADCLSSEHTDIRPLCYCKKQTK